MGALNGALSKLGRISQPLQRDITQAGLTISVSTVLLSALFLASVVYLIVRFFLFSSMLALGAAVAASLVPFIVAEADAQQSPSSSSKNSSRKPSTCSGERSARVTPSPPAC